MVLAQVPFAAQHAPLVTGGVKSMASLGRSAAVSFCRLLILRADCGADSFPLSNQPKLPVPLTHACTSLTMPVPDQVNEPVVGDGGTTVDALAAVMCVPPAVVQVAMLKMRWAQVTSLADAEVPPPPLLGAIEVPSLQS